MDEERKKAEIRKDLNFLKFKAVDYRGYSEVVYEHYGIKKCSVWYYVECDGCDKHFITSVNPNQVKHKCIRCGKSLGHSCYDTIKIEEE